MGRGGDRRKGKFPAWDRRQTKRKKTGGQENGRGSFFGEATNSGENGKERGEKIASEQIVEGETKEFFAVEQIVEGKTKEIIFWGTDRGRDKEGASGRIAENKA